MSSPIRDEFVSPGQPISLSSTGPSIGGSTPMGTWPKKLLHVQRHRRPIWGSTMIETAVTTRLIETRGMRGPRRSDSKRSTPEQRHEPIVRERDIPRQGRYKIDPIKRITNIDNALTRPGRRRELPSRAGQGGLWSSTVRGQLRFQSAMKKTISRRRRHSADPERSASRA